MTELLTRAVPSEADLVVSQVQAIDAFHRARRRAEERLAAAATSREGRMDQERRRDVLATQLAAVRARAELALADGVHLATRTVPVRVVVAHRNAWFLGRLRAALAERGLEVVCSTGNGAEAVGMVVAEQPDLVLVEDKVAMIGGEEVVREARRWAPAARVAAQVDHDDRVAPLLEAGADLALTRRVPPADVAAGLLELLDPERRPSRA
jgi:CheY-like chemotaxis protein